MQISKEGVILLYDNEYKEKENQPDLKAIGNYKGQQVEIAFWKNTDPNKKQKYNGKIQDRRQQPENANVPEDGYVPDEDLPF